jgi:signal transduction histidine kinase
MRAGTRSKKFSRLLMAEEEETKRLANKLHHDLAQSLYTIKLDLGKAIQQIKDNQINMGIENIESVILKIQETARQIQTIGMHLWPPILDDVGISAAISWFCTEFQRRHSGISVNIRIDVQEKDVPDFLKHVIYRILQEALNNIANDSKANLVHLFLSRRNATIELTVQDNGQGFDMERETLAGSTLVLGLSSMKERTELSGGAFTIESIQEKGTTIHASWQI